MAPCKKKGKEKTAPGCARGAQVRFNPPAPLRAGLVFPATAHAANAGNVVKANDVDFAVRFASVHLGSG